MGQEHAKRGRPSGRRSASQVEVAGVGIRRSARWVGLRSPKRVLTAFPLTCTHAPATHAPCRGKPPWLPVAWADAGTCPYARGSEALGGKRALPESVRTAALRKNDSSPTRSMPLAIASHSGHRNTGTLSRSSPCRLKKLLP